MHLYQPILGDPGAVSRVDKMFVVKVYCKIETNPWGAYHLTEKSGWGVESIMGSDLPVYGRNATNRYGFNSKNGESV